MSLRDHLPVAPRHSSPANAKSNPAITRGLEWQAGFGHRARLATARVK
jgi:hypothetical protein